jgi:Winged helix-turn helix
MAQVTAHLSLDALEARFVASRDARETQHVQTIWLLAKGHTVAEVSEMTAFGVRWIEQLLARYNAEGPQALGDLRRGNGARATVLTPELLDKLRELLRAPPADGGVWTSPQGGGVDGGGAWPGTCRSAARLGSVESGGLVNPGTSPTQPEGGLGGRGGSI